MSILLVLAAFVALAFLAGRFGTDSRPRDPACSDPQWPFHRHDG